MSNGVQSTNLSDTEVAALPVVTTPRFEVSSTLIVA